MSISKKGLLAGVATATVALVATFVAPAAPVSYTHLTLPTKRIV